MAQVIAVEAMKSRVRNSLTVADMKAVCRDVNLGVSGTKPILMNRIISRIDDLASRGEAALLASMRTSLLSCGKGALPPLPPPPMSSSSSSASRQHTSTISQTNGYAAGLHRASTGGGMNFKRSPFFEIQERLGSPTDLPSYPNHRHTVHIHFSLSQSQANQMRDDSSLRVLLYCAPKKDMATGTQYDIAFPVQIEVKVNEREVRTSYKGVKNKPGSTRPVDITAFLRKFSASTNTIATTYALTDKIFVIAAMLVKKRTIEELVDRIRKGRIIPRDRVVNEMLKRASDSDLVVESSTMSLKDPVSYLRIQCPIRSDICTHHQCFDALSFLQLQEQGPTWTCPICNKAVTFESLVVDKYFEDILNRTSNSITEVTVEPNAEWHTGSKGSIQSGAKEDTPDDSDDDVPLVRDSVKRESMSGAVNGTITPFSITAPTPPGVSPSEASASTTAASRPAKRKSEVVDLTLSDDDEPAPKRPAPNVVNGGRNAYGARNGYHNYPNTSSYATGQANPARQQAGSVAHDLQPHSISHGRHSFGRPSPLSSGTALAPINLTESPPNRPLSSTSHASPSFGFDYRQPALPHLPPIDFDQPSIDPLAGSMSRNNATLSHSPSEQRQALNRLANPFR